MTALAWLVLVGCVIGIGVSLWRLARRQAERQRESEARSVELLSEAARAIRDKAKAPGSGAQIGRASCRERV